MINGIQYKEHNGYLTATIDNQTLPLNLKEIVKDKVTINNNAETGIPLYTPIPIHIILTTINNNTIEKGLIKIQVIDVNKVIYEQNGYIKKGYYSTTIDKYLELGTYIIKVIYDGDKYFEPAELQYCLTVEKRPVLFKLDKTKYHGKPYEDINIHLQIYDELNNNSITNTRIDYIYNDIPYITRSDNEGNIDFEVTVPNDCNGDVISIYIDNEIYEYSLIKIPIITDRLDTEIKDIYNFEDEKIVIRGNVFAYNKDIMYNAQYGDIELYIGDELVSADTVENSIFQLEYEYNSLLSEYCNEEETTIKNKSDIDTQIELSIEADDIPGEIGCTVTVTDYNNRKITDGMVYFQLDDNKNHYISELNENGQAICYFYISKTGTYKIKYRYFGIFEYKDSEIKEKIIEVQ